MSFVSPFSAFSFRVLPLQLGRPKCLRVVGETPSQDVVEKPSSKETQAPPLNGIRYFKFNDFCTNTRPDSAVGLAVTHFWFELRELAKSTIRPKEGCLPELFGFTLDNAKIWEREQLRPPVKAPFLIRKMYQVICRGLDLLYPNRPIERFWLLETVARMPYFSYVSMLHLYETLGWSRAGELRKVHFAEEWNEMHHLMIVEALGGDRKWIDRFLAQHAAIVYYWLLILTYIIAPSWSYTFSELLEGHAVDTYGQFLDENEEKLKQLPAPDVAVRYYVTGDLYMFDDFQTTRKPETRRPPVRNLYDVFVNIRDDEGEHVKTMVACGDYSRLGRVVVSSHALQGLEEDGPEK
eukprot:CAMPEP_0184655750 /NCGR_PEP_ID=MMETSP0308-20130426/14396_1 /TAXON_ID=38269 /ORGANISM="Gloeochaete witrockiana, Strain SAG 46.84" /LENGTH=349 /DNA_ID=CAMNT_0027092483 /DNA_START=92 /DNA_END=1141 /DNA_ORIENTATION=+